MKETTTTKETPQFPTDTYNTIGAQDWSDDELAEHVINTVSQPRQGQSTSFTLHAPLEVLARHRLLTNIDDSRRESARIRLLGVATQMDDFGPAIATPDTPATSTRDLERLLDELTNAMTTGNLDRLDQTSLAAIPLLTPELLASSLVDPIAPFTSAAGHAPIFLEQALLSGLGSSSLPLLRPLVRELARFPDWRIRWVDAVTTEPSDIGRPSSIFEALAATPFLGEPGSNFIHPVMSRVDPDLAGSLLANTDRSSIPLVRQQITRAAALSMLIEPTDESPYGWSHCLTMPQALCTLATKAQDTKRLLAIAATHVVGFRAAFATKPLVAEFTPAAPNSSTHWIDALSQSPDEAAAAIWHGTASDAQIVGELASRAGAHHDTHLVKYTLACMDATKEDPAAGRLFLAAAAKLSAFWSNRAAEAD